jgi:hypothetical protein
MYEGFVNSPPTILTDDITDADTTIPVAELGVFPAAPNMATIGTGDDAETVLYGAKSAASGAGNLTSVTREYNTTGTYGVKKAWLSGSVIARNFTDADLDTIQSEISAANADIDDIQDDIDTLRSTHQLNLMAYSGIQPTTNPAEVSLTEMAVNAFPLPYAIFQSGAHRTVERLCWMTNIEENWDSSNITAQIMATIPSTETHDVTWLLYAVRVPSADTLAVTLPLVATITTSHVTAYKTYSSTVTSPFEITGTGNTILWELKRGTVGDTISVSAYYLNCKVLYGVL